MFVFSRQGFGQFPDFLNKSSEANIIGLFPAVVGVLGFLRQNFRDRRGNQDALQSVDSICKCIDSRSSSHSQFSTSVAKELMVMRASPPRHQRLADRLRHTLVAPNVAVPR